MKTEKFDIKGMSCSACSAAIERAMNKHNGIIKAEVNLLSNSMNVVYNDEITTSEEIIKTVQNTGYDAEIKKVFIPDNNEKEKKTNKKFIKLLFSSFFLILLMIVSMGHMIGINLLPDHMPILKGIVEATLLIPIIILNFKYFSSGFKALIKLNPNMDSLIAVGASASIIYSIWQMLSGGASHYYFESAGMILTFIAIGKYLESKSKAKTTSAVTKLLDLSPKTSIILVDGVEKETRDAFILATSNQENRNKLANSIVDIINEYHLTAASFL